MKRTENEEEKPKDVVHVRARRGQATDSHSLAERVSHIIILSRIMCQMYYRLLKKYLNIRYTILYSLYIF